jgi:hypothetical protein
VLRPYPVEPSLIERPLCRRCQARMMLARIEPGPAGSVLRTFECPTCERVQQVQAEDSIESRMVGWLNSGLRPPLAQLEREPPAIVVGRPPRIRSQSGRRR